jgi:hypothetical protein
MTFQEKKKKKKLNLFLKKTTYAFSEIKQLLGKNKRRLTPRSFHTGE